ncbi:MAG: hypothetical protein ACJ0J5_07090 [Dehalococcoidia bacterium]
MKNLFILSLVFIFFIIGCSEETFIYEPEINNDKLSFPFEERDGGKLGVIVRNLSSKIEPINMFLITRDVITDVKNQDYCNEVSKIREGRFIPEWTAINSNLPMMPESEVTNQNDHPNLISYNLPKGTYLLMLNHSETCSRDNYITFIIKTNSAFEE